VIDAPKIKVSREEFAEVLFYWLCMHVGKKGIEKTAKAFDLKVKGYKDFSTILRKVIGSKKDFDKVRIYEELFTLNMWLVVHNCERVFEDIDKRNECLDIFHRIVHQRLIEGTGENLKPWTLSMATRYIDYNKAAETEHHLGPLWVLSKVINKNLFGEVKEDPFLQFQIGVYITESMKALEEAIKKYDVE